MRLLTRSSFIFSSLSSFHAGAHSTFSHSEFFSIREDHSLMVKKVSLVFAVQMLSVLYNSSRMCLGFNSSIRLIKSPFSKQPSQPSSQSLRIFFKSRTLSFFKSTLFKSICFSVKIVKLSKL